MHTNYYFLRQLAPALKAHLVADFDLSKLPSENSITSTVGLRFMECFSQDRDEVVLIFAQARGKVNYYRPFYLKATLRPDFSGLIFPQRVQRARTNSVDLFDTVIGTVGQERAVIDVSCFLNERCLAIRLEDDFTLVFKFFGNRPNLLAFQGDTVIDLFNRQLSGDDRLQLSAFDRPIDQSYVAFRQASFDYRKLFPTFGKVVGEWLAERSVMPGKSDQDADYQWAVIQNALHLLNNPTFYLTRFHYAPTLSLVPIGTIQRELADPIDAANRYYIAHTTSTTFEREKMDVLRLLDKRQKRAQAQLDAILQRLIDREEGVRYEEKGHILMANLHEIQSLPDAKSPERLVLYDFYRDRPIELTLNPDVSPQKNAENFYRKAKNEKIEEQYLTNLATKREVELQLIGQQREEVTAILTLKELRRYAKQHHLAADSSQAGSIAQDAGPLFKEVTMNNFRILIGRNAKNNDLLTQKYAYKDDLWLHARDVAGSHVLIKYQAGKTFPSTVIERAAELAAWYSKRRTDSLCPVTVTPKKFVRKPKGLAEGQVIVDKEEVVLVVPRGE